MEREGAEVPVPGPKLEARASSYGPDDPALPGHPPGRPGSNPEQNTGWERPNLRVRKPVPSPFCEAKGGTRRAKQDAGGSYTTKTPPHPTSYPSCTSMQVPPTTIPPIHASPIPRYHSYLSVERFTEPSHHACHDERAT